MAKKLQRRKPGYTRAGEVKIISLSVRQLTELKAKHRPQKNRSRYSAGLICCDIDQAIRNLLQQPHHRTNHENHTPNIQSSDPTSKEVWAYAITDI